MALTKHQKLARAIKHILHGYDQFHEKVAKSLDVLQFHFHETYLCVGRPLITEGSLKTMMYTHCIGMKHFSQSEELRTACATKPLIGFHLASHFFTSSRTLINPQETPSNAKWIVPWGVRISLPSKTFKSLEDAKLEALLYCASDSEMSEWIDWLEKEDRARSLSNQLSSIATYYENDSILKTNLIKPALPFFEETALGFYGKAKHEKMLKRLNKTDFAPSQETTLAQSYDLVISSLKARDKRYHDDFKRTWIDRLEALILEGVDWPKAEKEGYFKEWRTNLTVANGEISPAIAKRHRSISGWKPVLALDRQTYASFILHFAKKFLEKPTNKRFGEIALFLWIMVHIAQDSTQAWTIKQLLGLTTANLKGHVLSIEDGKEVELTSGLADLFHAYTGGKCLEREQNLLKNNKHKERRKRLFSNLTIDNLEDALHKASKELLPKNSLPALPKAFLTFLDSIKHFRMTAEIRKQQQMLAGKTYHDHLPWRELKQQIIDKNKNS